MTLALGRDQVTVGAAPDNDVVLAGIAPHHARVVRQGGQLFFIEMIVMLVSVVVYFVSFLLTMALSRYRELAADRSGAILIGRPSQLASALVKISGDMGRIPTKDLRSSEPFNAFFIVPAVSQGAQDTSGGRSGGGFSFGSLFRTHPTLERRLAQLDQLEHQLGQAS